MSDVCTPGSPAAVGHAVAAALAARDVAALTALLAPDVRWGPELDTARTCHGREQVGQHDEGLLASGADIEVVEVRPGRHSSRHQVLLRTRVRWPGDNFAAPANGGADLAAHRLALLVTDGLVADLRELCGPPHVIELLFFEGCPNHDRFLPHLRALLDGEGVDEPIHLVEVTSDAAARDLEFLGSPSLRIDGEDVDPSARTRGDFAVQCRLYRTAEGVRGTPPDDWVRDLLHRRDRS